MYPNNFIMPNNYFRFGGINTGFLGNAGRNFFQANPLNSLNRLSVSGRNIFGNLFNNIKAINWKGLLNGTSKTINTINQAIPLIRNTRPMINNIKNMVNIAKAFGKETAIDSVVSSKNLIHNSDTQILNDNIKVINEKNYPTFFI